jgi:hypothetical protein
METFYIKDARIGSFIWIIPETRCQERDKQGEDLIAQVVGKDAKFLKVICLPNPCSGIELEIINTYRYRNRNPSWYELSPRSKYFGCQSIYPLSQLLQETTLPYYIKMEVGGCFGKIVLATKNDLDKFIKRGQYSYNEIHEAQEEEKKAQEEEKYPWIKEERLAREARERQEGLAREARERQERLAREARERQARLARKAREAEKLEKERQRQQAIEQEKEQQRQQKKLTVRERFENPESAFWIRSFNPIYLQIGLKAFDLKIGQSILVCNCSDEKLTPQKGYIRGFLPPEELLNEAIKKICIQDLRRRYKSFPYNMNIFDDKQNYLIEIKQAEQDIQLFKSDWYVISVDQLPRVKGRIHRIDLEGLRIT